MKRLSCCIWLMVLVAGCSPKQPPTSAAPGTPAPTNPATVSPPIVSAPIALNKPDVPPVDQAKLIATFLVRRGLRHVTLAGHSFGGQVAMMTALELARRDPTRIERLILIDAPALPQPMRLSG